MGRTVSRILGLAVCVLCHTSSVVADEAALSDTEIWNEGVEYYRGGDFTNALRVLKPLILSKEYGPRAAEVVAAISYDRAHTPGEAKAIDELEEAAVAAQIALRATPDDSRARRNFARTVAKLPELRATRRINDALAAAQGKDPDAMLAAAMREARLLMKESATYRTNAAPVAVAKADALSARAEKLSDKWIAVRELLANSITNEDEAAVFLTRVDTARNRNLEGAKALADMTDGAYSPLAEVEDDWTYFYKRVAGPHGALAEDELSQSNAWQDVETINNRSWQSDALDYTRRFRAVFPAWAQQYEQMAQADTNKPPFTAEAQAEISALSTQLEKLQLECVNDILPPKQEEALEIIRKIRELLPKDQSGGGQSGQQGQPQKQDGENNKNDQPQPDQNENDDQAQGRQEDEPQQDEQEQEAAEGEESDEDEQPDDKDIEAILKKAQERNDEHEAEKKARMRKAPLPPNERDW